MNDTDPEAKQLLLRALRLLSLDDQVLLELRYWEKLTTAELAEALGISPRTARMRLRRARLCLLQIVEALSQRTV